MMFDRGGHMAGLLLVAVAAVIWSTGGLIVRSLDATDAWTTIFYRSLFAAAFLILFVVLRDRGRALASFSAMGSAGLLVAACFATASISLVVALGMTSVANTLVVMSTAPLLAAVLGRWFLGDAVKRSTWWASGATMVGVAVMVSGSSAQSSLAGDAVAVLMPVSLATATVTIRHRREVTMVPAMAVGMVLATLIAVPCVVLGNSSGSILSGFSVSTRDLGLLVAFGSLQLGAGLALYATGARNAPPGDVALVALLEPVLGPIWVWWLIGENPGRAAVIGGLIVVVALMLHTAVDLRRRTVPVMA